MQRALLLLMALALPAAAQVKLPDEKAFFEAIGIRVADGESAQFVVGDNVAGYLEAWTHAFHRGEGYTIGAQRVWYGYRSYRGERLLDRARQGRETILPYGHHVDYGDGTEEEMALLSGQQAIAMRVRSTSPAALGIGAHIENAGGKVIYFANRRGVLFAPKAGIKDGLWTALVADSPAELRYHVSICSHCRLQPWEIARSDVMLKAEGQQRSLTMVAAFAATAQEAEAKALALIQGDPIARERRLHYARLTRSQLWTDDERYNKALAWAKASAASFVVQEFGAGIWAGLPWFRDNWGRDTFIALPGTLLVSGHFDTARAVLENFARYQDLKDPQDRFYGRIPNRVSSGDIIYNTVDGTPWMLREALEYIRYSGDSAFARRMLPLVQNYVDGALRHFVDVDGLLTHDDADTWMDARIEGKEAWSPRGSRAVEIQALWYTALMSGAELAEHAGQGKQAAQWRAQAARAQASFLRLFWDGERMADRLRADGSRDMRMRPNQLMLATIPFDDFIPPALAARVTKNTVGELLYPYGIASLAQDDPFFHPRHENPAHHHKDAAYHQGTVWGWNAGFTTTALTRFGYQDLAYALADNLAVQMLALGTRGSMSELLDALPDEQGRIKPSGTYAQSWSVAEYVRNGYQDFLGFRPDLLAGVIDLHPAVPSAWQRFSARLPFGRAERLDVDFRRDGAVQEWTLRLAGSSARQLRVNFLDEQGARQLARMTLRPGRAYRLRLDGATASLDGKTLAVAQAQASFRAQMGDLGFRRPPAYRAEDFPVTRGKDVLKDAILRGDYR